MLGVKAVGIECDIMVTEGLNEGCVEVGEDNTAGITDVGLWCTIAPSGYALGFGSSHDTYIQI